MSARQFMVQLALVCTLVFLIQVFLLQHYDHPPFDNQLILAYAVNMIIALGVVLTINAVLHRMKNSLGFIFIAGSGLKFVLFFLLFYPEYKADDQLTLLEFFAFFVPYVCCLFLEVRYLAKLLNNQGI
ncbi:DUF6168 family protein [Croceiramulus getboli]|nr:DUF6168 family protein [Flavobacteriaceae bacterium YJPT1-3]